MPDWSKGPKTTGYISIQDVQSKRPNHARNRHRKTLQAKTDGPPNFQPKMKTNKEPFPHGSLCLLVIDLIFSVVFSTFSISFVFV